MLPGGFVHGRKQRGKNNAKQVKPVLPERCEAATKPSSNLNIIARKDQQMELRAIHQFMEVTMGLV